MQHEPTIRELQRDIQDVKDAVNIFATDTEKHFQKIESQLGGMVTKDYLDQKRDGLRNDLVHALRKEFAR